MCMDQFGWTEEETVLKFGIVIASTGVMCVFLFGSIGPLTKKIDERKILIFLGISFMLIGRLVVFPIPGFPTPPMAGSGNGTSGNDTSGRVQMFVIRFVSPCLITAL